MSLFHHVRCVSNTTHPNLSSLLPTTVRCYCAVALLCWLLSLTGRPLLPVTRHSGHFYISLIVYIRVYVYGTYNRSIMFTLHYPYHTPFQLHLVHTHKCVCIFSTTYIHIHISNQMNLRYCSFSRNIFALYL